MTWLTAHWIAVVLGAALLVETARLWLRVARLAQSTLGLWRWR